MRVVSSELSISLILATPLRGLRGASGGWVRVGLGVGRWVGGELEGMMGLERVTRNEGVKGRTMNGEKKEVKKK
ncbi:hypothetical protein E2C01_073910 [Portunus trituberculatus]|uniref:Uncharacterized protein n=1 Tax=Portunus trituberculatus TaxID=210409 RepID=A0A5B7IFC2_PORTR|nr:hypothetical protein [Portunus trituberculatus]